LNYCGNLSDTVLDRVDRQLLLFGRLYRCVQSQNIGLECNVLNGLDDFSERPDFGLF